MTGDVAGVSLHFWCVSHTRGSWLACISSGRVDAVVLGDQLSVIVGGGLRPVAIYGGIAALLATLFAALLSVRSTWFLGLVAVTAGGNYLYAYFGLPRVAEAVLDAATPTRAAGLPGERPSTPS